MAATTVTYRVHRTADRGEHGYSDGGVCNSRALLFASIYESFSSVVVNRVSDDAVPQRRDSGQPLHSKEKLLSNRRVDFLLVLWKMSQHDLGKQRLKVLLSKAGIETSVVYFKR